MTLNISSYDFDQPGVLEQYMRDLQADRAATAANTPGMDQAAFQGLQSNLGSGNDQDGSFNNGLMAINPATGQPERVYVSTTPDPDGNPHAAQSRYYFESDPNRPANATSGSVGGYGSDNGGGLGGLLSKIGTAALGTAGFGVGGVSGASAATGNGVTPQTIGADAAGLAAGAGLASALPGLGLSTPAAPGMLSANAQFPAMAALGDSGASGVVWDGAASGMEGLEGLGGVEGLGGAGLGAAGITNLPTAAAPGLAGAAAGAGAGAAGAGASGLGAAGAAGGIGALGQAGAAGLGGYLNNAIGQMTGQVAPGAYQFPYGDAIMAGLGVAGSQATQNTLQGMFQQSLNADPWNSQMSRYQEPLYQAATQGIGNTAYGQSIANQASRSSAAKGYNMSGNMLHDVAQGLNSGTNQYIGALSPLAMGRAPDQRGVAGIAQAMGQATGGMYNSLGYGLGSIVNGQQPALGRNAGLNLGSLFPSSGGGAAGSAASGGFNDYTGSFS
jgi:hypothetical protein